jgi:tripartite-type tricarboxylate transporter receptor subunit TctC
MMHKSARTLRILCSSLVAALGLYTAWAQAADYPNRPITIVCAFPPGSGADMAARAISTALGTELNSSVIVENRGGAGGAIGARYAARAPADGYTLFAPSISYAMMASMTNLSFDPVKAFEPIIRIGTQEMILVAKPSLNVKNINDFIKLAKSEPGKLNYGSGGIGSMGHLQVEVLQRNAGIQLLHVPYKGTPEAVSDLLGGRVDMTLATIPQSLPLIKAGRLTALSIQGPVRIADLPDTPTTAQAGFPDAGDGGWYLVMAPAGTPAAIINRLNTALRNAVKKPEVIKSFATAGLIPSAGSPKEATDFLESQMTKWRGVVAEAHIEKINPN